MTEASRLVTRSRGVGKVLISFHLSLCRHIFVYLFIFDANQKNDWQICENFKLQFEPNALWKAIFLKKNQSEGTFT